MLARNAPNRLLAFFCGALTACAISFDDYHAGSESGGSNAGGGGGGVGGGDAVCDGLDSGWRAAATGFDHTCAITCAGDLYCWGNNERHQLGPNATEDTEEPRLVDAAALSKHVGAVAAGAVSTCALLDASSTEPGSVWCWGGNDVYQLGDDGSEREDPTQVQGVTATQIASGDQTVCAIIDGGKLLCWGANRHKQAAPGVESDRQLPTTNVTLENGDELADVVQVDIGGRMESDFTAHTCVRTGDSRVLCWGANNSGEAAPGSPDDQEYPAAIMRPDLRNVPFHAKWVSAGVSSSAMLTTDDDSFAWGVPWPGISTSLDHGGDAITVTTSHACILDGGDVHCVGADNDLGQLGNGTTDALEGWTGALPFEGAGDVVIAVDTHADHTCAVTGDHKLFCWGNNASGQCGQDPGELQIVTSPMEISAPQ